MCENCKYFALAYDGDFMWCNRFRCRLSNNEPVSETCYSGSDNVGSSK